jgi:hypothetical protein
MVPHFYNRNSLIGNPGLGPVKEGGVASENYE